jgi:hypothetical protein
MKPDIPNISAVAAFFMTVQNSARIPMLCRFLDSAKKHPKLVFDYWIINYTTYNDTEKHFLFPPDRYRELMQRSSRSKKFQKHIDLSAKFFFSLRFFLENTTAEWLYRASDDGLINFDNLAPYLAYLDRKYKPLTESIIIGNCIDSRKFSYLQGGTGYLISRHLAERMHILEGDYFQNLKQPEDVYFSDRVFKAFNLSLTESTSPFFLGHDVYDGHLNALLRGQGEALPLCPNLSAVWTKTCQKFIVPLQDTVFWHREGYVSDLNDSIDYFRLFMGQPRHVMWWINRARPYLCRAMEVYPREY